MIARFNIYFEWCQELNNSGFQKGKGRDDLWRINAGATSSAYTLIKNQLLKKICAVGGFVKMHVCFRRVSVCVLLISTQSYLEDLVRLREVQLSKSISNNSALEQQLADTHLSHSMEKEQLEYIILELQNQL